MDLISLVITLIVVGVLLWLVNNYIPMDGQIKRLLNGVVVIATVIWLLDDQWHDRGMQRAPSCRTPPSP